MYRIVAVTLNHPDFEAAPYASSGRGVSNYLDVPFTFFSLTY
jgi:hypothetical protein